MQIIRWSAAAALAAMIGLTPSYASDELSTMKASMDNMKIEMEAMRSQMAAEREALRANAGGAPEGLLSAKGNATIRIGGDVRLQYQIGWGNGYNRQGYTAYDEPGYAAAGNSNYRSTKAGWDVARAQLKFDVDLSCDTKGFISLRFDERGAFGATNILENAYWQWNNIGGTGLGLKIGLQDMPFGMYNNGDTGGYSYGVDRAIITDPFVKNMVKNIGLINNGQWFDTLNNMITKDVTTLGVVASYNFDDQLVVKGALMAGGFNNYTLTGKATDGNSLTWDNQIRNPGFVDHIVSVGWNPCWLEGLHLELSYMGTWDSGRGGQWNGTDFVNNNPYRHNYTQSIQGDSEYRPTFDIGVCYKINDQFRAFAEGVLAWNPMYSDGYGYAMTVGLDYRMTEKLMFGASFDYMHGSYSGDTWVGADGATRNVNNGHSNLYRMSLGAKYDFGNGLYFQAQYYHDLCYMAGVGDQDTKDADTILFQTGYQF